MGSLRTYRSLAGRKRENDKKNQLQESCLSLLYDYTLDRVDFLFDSEKGEPTSTNLLSNKKADKTVYGHSFEYVPQMGSLIKVDGGTRVHMSIPNYIYSEEDFFGPKPTVVTANDIKYTPQKGFYREYLIYVLRDYLQKYNWGVDPYIFAGGHRGSSSYVIYRIEDENQYTKMLVDVKIIVLNIMKSILQSQNWILDEDCLSVYIKCPRKSAFMISGLGDKGTERENIELPEEREIFWDAFIGIFWEMGFDIEVHRVNGLEIMASFPLSKLKDMMNLDVEDEKQKIILPKQDKKSE